MSLSKIKNPPPPAKKAHKSNPAKSAFKIFQELLICIRLKIQTSVIYKKV